jgi:hypothetical protein
MLGQFFQPLLEGSRRFEIGITEREIIYLVGA